MSNWENSTYLETVWRILSNCCFFSEGQKIQQQMLVSVLNNHKVARVLWIFSFLIAREQERERALWPTVLPAWAKLDFHTEQEARRGCWVGFEHCDLKFEVCWVILCCGPTWCLHMEFKWFINDFWDVISFPNPPPPADLFSSLIPHTSSSVKSGECHLSAPNHTNQSFLCPSICLFL